MCSPDSNKTLALLGVLSPTTSYGHFRKLAKGSIWEMLAI